MDEEVDDWTLSENSEDEKDLEIALYSQVHFDPVPEVSGKCHKSDCSLKFGNPQFCVGIEEISLPVKMSNKENLSCDNDCMIISTDKDEIVDKSINSVRNTIYVTSSDEDDNVEFVLSEEQQFKNLNHQYENVGSNNQLLPENCLSKDRHVDTTSKAVEDELIICEDIDYFNDEDENDDLLIMESYSQQEGSLSLSETKEKPSAKLDLSVNQGNSREREDIICADEIVESEIDTEPIGECLHKTKGNAAEPVVFLPFSITKPSLNLQKEVMSEGSDSDDKQKSHTTQQKMIKDRPFIMTSTDANFLKVSKGKKLGRQDLKFEKKKKLSKQEAAVQPRKPPVLIRKPPVVKVSYEQDSDTNTDYSDSDIDSKPVKGHSDRHKLSASHRSGKCTRVKSIKENSSSSSSKTGSRIEVQRQTNNKRRYSKVEEDRSSSENDEVENEKPMRSDSDTDSSIISHGMDAVHNPALDFNIEGGVEGLLKCSNQDEEEKWQISDQDRYQILLTKSRYFSPLSFTCRNCNKEGHKAADCPQPKKSLCILCGELGHLHFSCPSALCFNCNEPGHQRKDCRVPFRGRRSICNRCWMPGHDEEICPDRWRQYHLTCVTDNRKIVTASEEHRNPKVYCYNCGEKGHLGYECKEVLMNRYIFPNYPFIAHYNKSGSMKGQRKNNSVEEYKRRKRPLEKDREHERSKEHKKKKHQTKQSHRTFSKGKDEARRTGSQNAKFTEEKRDWVFQREKNKKMKTEETGKEHKKHSRNEKQHYSDRNRIVTETTVFSFQDHINTDNQEKEYNFSTKRKCFTERNNKDLWHHKSHRSSITSNQYHESQHHREMKSEYDYDMDHQVFHNKWWNEESYSFDQKKRKRKASLKNSTSRWDHDNAVKRTERQPDHIVHNSRKKKNTDHERIQNLQISFHSNRQYHYASKREVVGIHRQHNPHFRSSNQSHSKKERKSGFQMNTHFHSLSTTFKKKGKEKQLL